MAPAIASATTDPATERGLSLSWTGRLSLTTRILAVNVLALLLLAGGFFYLDSYRLRLLDMRTQQQARETRLIATALAGAAPAARPALAVRLGQDTGARVRLYGADGGLAADTLALGLRNFVLRDPDRQSWRKDAARFLDAGVEAVAGAQRTPLYRERASWPDVAAARRGATAATVWRAPDRTPVLTAAAALGDGAVVMTTVNARNITATVRDERLRLAIVLGVVTLISVLLSLFLARTIVKPIRRLALATVRVRRGRAREVVVPRLPSRADELGMLARAVSDMAGALRQRIDATEAFAADVTHELKNPLASLRSAVDALARVEDPALRGQLLEIAAADVHRLDRLITDISDASRIDAQLSRAKYEPVDVAALLERLIAARDARGNPRGARLAFVRGDGPATVTGDGARLERVFENLVDNAISFSPPDGVVRVQSGIEGGDLVVRVDDEGPGVPDGQHEAIFSRFHSVRPADEAFGQHSGLGLAIARTIVLAHQGSVAVEPSPRGARFAVRLPLAEGAA